MAPLARGRGDFDPRPVTASRGLHTALATCPNDPTTGHVVKASIAERQRVACPAGAAAVFLERDFELQHSDRQCVSLHVRVPLLGLLSLDKEVTVFLAPAHTGDDYAMRVAWEPAGGPFPRFRGTLRVVPVGDETAFLELAGEYEPPGGAAGFLFDRLLGRRVARATVRDLLARIGRSVGDEYERRLRSAVI